MGRIRPRVAGLAVALVATIGGLGPSPAGASTASAASAAKAAAPVVALGGSCTPLVGCSQIHNDSHTFVIIRPTWTCGGGTGSTGGPECTSGSSQYLYSGGRTPTNQDWDTFRVDPGWCYKVKFYLPYRSWTVKYNRVGLGEQWVKVEDWATAVIQAQQPGSCPA